MGEGKRARRSSASSVLIVLALVLAFGGGAIAATGLNGKQRRQVKAIADGRVHAHVREVFKRAPAQGISHIATLAGFKLKVDCLQDGIFVFLIPPPGVAVDGASFSPTAANEIFGKDKTPLVLTDTQESASFSVATKSGSTLSGTIASDFPGVGGTFGNDTSHCVVSGHVVVDTSP